METMTQENKELLLKDLCARIPYGVKVKLGDNPNIFDLEYRIKFAVMYGDSDNLEDILNITNIKPYLFPLSSMTEEQKQEYTYIVNYISPDDTDNWKEGEFIYVEQFSQLMHFYHINHLDYMGLIPMGLAEDATGLNIY